LVNFTINKISVSGHKDQSILDVAKEYCIFIPSLCHHKALSPYGSCRICLVEVEKAGRKRVVASCSYLVEEGIQVNSMNMRENTLEDVFIHLTGRRLRQ